MSKLPLSFATRLLYHINEMTTQLGGIKMQKSKLIFFILALVAVFFLTMFSFAIAATNILWMCITFLLLMATLGYGFSLKKKYRENDWL